MLKDRDAMGPAASPCAGGGGDGGGGGPAVCGGCGLGIADRYYLLAADRSWHQGCLKCGECRLPLDSELTCFARDGRIYCKEDYYRLFAVKRCARCRAGISATELVMRARDLVYHLHCFTCCSCGAHLAKGDHFGLRDGLVYCRPHYELLFSPHDASCPSVELSGAFFGAHKGRPRKRRSSAELAELPVALRIPAGALELLHPGDLNSSMDSLTAYDSSVSSPGNPGGQQRTKRMRTSFKHHQLRTMKSYFAINQNPDAKDLKQLAQKTGLSKRVLQVWFQNARAKWRRNMMRQEGAAQQPGGGAGGGGGGGPAPGPALGDSNSLPAAPSHDEMHRPPLHHLHHAQTTQTLSFADLY